MKTRKELLTEAFICKSEIKRLLNVSTSVASKVFDVAHQIDLQELGRSRMFYYGKKVRLKTVMKVMGIDFNLLSKQIKSGLTNSIRSESRSQ